MSSPTLLSNYITYLDPSLKRSRVGHYDHATTTIQPLCFTSGTYISDLYQVIEAGKENITKTDEEPIPSTQVKILPPLPERDVLCVGKNYLEHAKEFNSSGFDNSDKVDLPSHPVIFTKRFTSIIAHEEEIYSHPEFTKTADYEGEIGVIIGKPCYRTTEADAMDYVWGFTIINDMTARERQRDHKQFYIGKSPDTFCPMGPIAVPKEHIGKVLRVQTRVNGELRQDATTEDLIFAIPFLLKTMSEGQTLLPGDVLATGTPAGVGIGRNPPVYLSPGDTISISVNGLGTLTNRIASLDSIKPHISTSSREPRIPLLTPSQTQSLTTINGKPTHYTNSGSKAGPSIIFIHGLGLNTEYFTPMIAALNLESTHNLHRYDIEGHGQTPTSPLSKLAIDSFAHDLAALIAHTHPDGVQEITLIAQGLGCLIALQYASMMKSALSFRSFKLLLLHPPPMPLSEDDKAKLHNTAHAIRHGTMHPWTENTFLRSENEPICRNPLAFAALRLSAQTQDREGYAKACTALASASAIDLRDGLAATSVMVVTGSEDRFATPERCKRLVLEEFGGNAGLEIVSGVGQWVGFEDVEGLKGAVEGWIRG